MLVCARTDLPTDLAGWADKLEGSTFETNDGFYKLVRREPFGVVAGVASFNATLLYFCYKVTMAIAAGNCVSSQQHLPPQDFDRECVLTAGQKDHLQGVREDTARRDRPGQAC